MEEEVKFSTGGWLAGTLRGQRASLSSTSGLDVACESGQRSTAFLPDSQSPSGAAGSSSACDWNGAGEGGQRSLASVLD